jgi:hypothetical protein
MCHRWCITWCCTFRAPKIWDIGFAWGVALLKQTPMGRPHHIWCFFQNSEMLLGSWVPASSAVAGSWRAAAEHMPMRHYGVRVPV